MVIIGGGIDLSVGKVMALASVWSTTVATQSYGPVVMVFCALAVGAGCGLVNGLLIAYGRIVPFIVTLAMLISAQGLAEQISGRRSQIVTDPTIAAIANTRLLGIPLLVYIFAAVVAVGWVVLNRTTFGRRTFAIGGNPEAARLAGLDVRRHTVALYVVSGLCCGIAAIMIASLTTTGSSPTERSTSWTRSPPSSSAARCSPEAAHPGRLHPRGAGVHHDHQPVRAEQPGHRGPEHRQGRDHRRRRADPDPRPALRFLARPRPPIFRCFIEEGAPHVRLPAHPAWVVAASLTGVGRVGAGVALTACTSNAPAAWRPGRRQRPRSPAAGGDNAAPRRPGDHRLLRARGRPRLDRRDRQQRQGAGGPVLGRHVRGGEPHNDITQQIAAVETLINKKVNALVLLPNDGSQLTSTGRKAMAAGIPVINLDRIFDTPLAYRTWIGGDNYGMGVSAGTYVGEQLKAKGVANPIIGEIAGIDSLPLTQARSKGFADALASYGFAVGPRQAADFTAQGGQRVAANLLQGRAEAWTRCGTTTTTRASGCAGRGIKPGGAQRVLIGRRRRGSANANARHQVRQHTC
jgi:hypothetical protein